MTARRKSKSATLLLKTAELALAAPQVVAHRVTRMAMAGSSPSASDRKEFHRMGAEKTAAFQESWTAMAMQAFRANQSLTASFFRAFWLPPFNRTPSASAAATQWQNAALGVLGKGMAPVHRRAVANARRLARTRLR